jgi:hypothetical protein
MTNVKWSDLERPVLEYIFQKLLLAENGTKYVSDIYQIQLIPSSSLPNTAIFFINRLNALSLHQPTNPTLSSSSSSSLQVRTASHVCSHFRIVAQDVLLADTAVSRPARPPLPSTTTAGANGNGSVTAVNRQDIPSPHVPVPTITINNNNKPPNPHPKSPQVGEIFEMKTATTSALIDGTEATSKHGKKRHHRHKGNPTTNNATAVANNSKKRQGRSDQGDLAARPSSLLRNNKSIADIKEEGEEEEEEKEKEVINKNKTVVKQSYQLRQRTDHQLLGYYYGKSNVGPRKLEKRMKKPIREDNEMMHVDDGRKAAAFTITRPPQKKVAKKRPYAASKDNDDDDGSEIHDVLGGDDNVAAAAVTTTNKRRKVPKTTTTANADVCHGNAGHIPTSICDNNDDNTGGGFLDRAAQLCHRMFPKWLVDMASRE